MKSNNIILLDCDGILFDLHKKVADRLADLFGDAVDVAECTNNSPAKGFAGVCPEASGWVKAMLAEPGFYRDLQPMEGVETAMEEIVEMGLHPVILSSLGDAPGCAADKVARIREVCGNRIHPRDYVFTSQKNLVRGRYFIDDGAEYLKSWKKENPEGTTLTFRRSYTYPGDADVYATSWERITEWLWDNWTGIEFPRYPR